VPNPEWFDRHDLRLLSHIDRIWAKTGNTQQIFQRLSAIPRSSGSIARIVLIPAPRQRLFIWLEKAP
jgi:hypothetical protein